MPSDPLHWGAVIAAAGEAEASLSAATGSRTKALTPFAGRPALHYVLESCRAVGIGQIAVVAGTDVRSALGPLGDSEAYAPPGGSAFESTRNGMAVIQPGRPLLFLPCDCPLLNARHVRSFIEAVAGVLGPRNSGSWFAAGLAGKEAVEQALPGARYRYVKLREGRFAAGALYAASRPGVESALTELQAAVGNRKSQLRLAMRFGLLNLLRYFSGTVSMSEAERLAGRLLGGEAHIIPDCHPFTTMDFDTPEDWRYLIANFDRLRHEGV